ncbi:MAG: hypothetical protein HY360_01145 [Verrucomicrobia bacterium]|nr:hypothetical protein [Verrucomicrobiota bacterium]
MMVIRILFLAFAFTSVSRAVEIRLLLSLQRTAYQTNERIDFSVVRPAAIPGELTLTLTGEEGSNLAFTFQVKRATEHVFVNGWLLRPGKYTVEAATDGVTAKTEIAIFSHVRKSSFRLINWGRAQKKEEQLPQGEEDLGFNLFYGNFGDDRDANFIRAGVDVMGVCVMSGGHQMDLRLECDWSDPYVTRGGAQRVVRKAFEDRSRGNVPGVHFYDEPGLTWWKNPETGEFGPHDIPAQARSFEAAFDRKPPLSYKLDPNKPDDIVAWKHWATWKLGLMDAAWKEAQFGVSYVRPDFISATQSQYGWSAFTDGYYFNVVRGLPVISGHGGYHDFGPGYFNPSYFLEMARARDFARPNWYLPTWYGNTTSDEFRLEQYLAFITNIQGLMSPPDLEPATNGSARQGIVESNHLAGRIGTIFDAMPVTRPPVAMLYSMSQLLDAQAKDRKVMYAHDQAHGRSLMFAYLAGKLLQQQFLAVTDEDVVDGTLAAHHKVVILPAIDYLDPAVVKALEDFIMAGGLALKTADSKINIKGAIDLGVTPALPDAQTIEKLTAEIKKDGKNEWGRLEPYQTVAKYFQASEPLAKAIKAQLDKAGVKPIFACDASGIVAAKQGEGDLEYLFAVNATPDAAAGKRNAMKAVDATLTLEADGRPVYDAIHGGAVGEFKDKSTGKFRFGPGQMRVFARSTRPIGGIKVGAPALTHDLTGAENPIGLRLAATLLDAKGGVLSGSAPLRVRVIDPLGVTRYDLYRATKLGAALVELPLAANDPAGEWKVIVTELLNNTQDQIGFHYQPMPRCGALAGTARRAVSLPGEKDNLFRFARVNHDVTIARGSGDYNVAAAERLKKILDPWGVRCTIGNAADLNKPRSLTAEEAQTWCGLQYAGSGQVKPGDQNNPSLVGFAINGPVILLGTPEDNPLIKFLVDQRFLPYVPDAGGFPGKGRGCIAWQRDAIGKGQESIALIAYDAEGMAEAVGSLYEAVAGLDPLTPWTMATAHSIAVAKNATVIPELDAIWSVVLPDRVVAITGEKDALAVLTEDGTLSEVNVQGKVGSQRVLAGADYKAKAESVKLDPTAIATAQKNAGPTHLVKLVSAAKGLTAIAYWGGRVEIRAANDAIKSVRKFPQDVTALTWRDDQLVCGDADGGLHAFAVK